jgi:hypothetical protein
VSSKNNQPDHSNLGRYRRNLQGEIDSAALYHGLGAAAVTFGIGKLMGVAISG